jgi:hypothetical protein
MSDVRNWASDATYTSGAESGLAPTYDPGDASTAQGFLPSEPIPAAVLNWAIAELGNAIATAEADIAALESAGGGSQTPQWLVAGFPSRGLLTTISGIEHFLQATDGLHGFLATQAGTGAAASAGQAPAGRVGVVQCTTGTTTTGSCGLTGGLTSVRFGGGRHRARWDVQFAAASDGTETYTARVGFIDSTSGEPTDGVFFRYTHSVNSAQWVCVTRAAGVETTTNTSVTLGVGTYRVFEIEVNAAGTEVKFYLDGTLVATHTANIPTSTARTALGAAIVKSAGTTARTMDLDLCAWSFEPTTPL